MTTAAELGRRIVGGAKASFGAQLLFAGSNALLVVLLTRVFLTPTEFGRLHFALSVLGLVSMFAVLGIPRSTARYVTQYAERDPTQLPHILRRSLLYLVVLTTVASVVLGAGSARLAVVLGEPAVAPLLLLGALFVAGHAVAGHFIVVFQGFNRVSWSALLTAVSGVSRVGFAVVFLLLGLGALGALLGYIVGYALAATIGGVLLYRYYYSRYEAAAAMEPGLGRRILEYSVPLTATKGAGALDNRVDIILVGVLLSPVAVGFYTVAKQVSSLVSTPAGAYGFALSPTLGEQKASDRLDRAALLYERSLRYLLWFYVPAVVGLVLVARPLVTVVFGPAYAPATPVLQVFGAVVLVQAINNITSDGLDFLGRASDRAVTKGVMGISNVVLNLLLIPPMGVTGAAVATAITWTFYAGANVYIIQQELPVDLRRLGGDLIHIGAVTAVMAGVVVLALPFVGGPLSLLATVGLGGLVWFGLSVVSGLVDPAQLRATLSGAA